MNYINKFIRLFYFFTISYMFYQSAAASLRILASLSRKFLSDLATCMS